MSDLQGLMENKFPFDFGYIGYCRRVVLPLDMSDSEDGRPDQIADQLAKQLHRKNAELSSDEDQEESEEEPIVPLFDSGTQAKE